MKLFAAGGKPIQWWCWDKVTKAFGGWPGNTLENKWVAALTYTGAHYQSKLCCKVLIQPFPAACTPQIYGQQLGVLQDWGQQAITGPCIVVDDFLTTSLPAMVVVTGTTTDGELCGLANAVLAGRELCKLQSIHKMWNNIPQLFLTNMVFIHTIAEFAII